MIDHIYVEHDLVDHRRVLRVRRRYPQAQLVVIDHYGEIFNRRAQNFRVQKQRPALILARKRGRRVIETPATYGIGSDRNYYFSHVLNCLYDCRYCFLQGMYPSAHYVVFVNLEDFQREIDDTIGTGVDGTICFFSGYDGDSLALESLSGFVSEFLPFVAERPQALFELRTKSTAIKPLLGFDALENCVLAFSFTPQQINTTMEHGVGSNDARIDVAGRLAELGWPIGLRFDPLLFSPDFEQRYDALFAQVFSRLDSASIHSVSWGPFRLPRPYFKRMSGLYPEEPIFSGSLEQTQRLVSYSSETEQTMMAFCRDRLARFVPGDRLFPIS